MYAISSYENALIIQIIVHSHTKEVGRGASKQMIKCITMFLYYKSFIDLLTYLNILYRNYFECLFFCVAPMSATNLTTISGLICYNVKFVSMYNFMGQIN